MEENNLTYYKRGRSVSKSIFNKNVSFYLKYLLTIIAIIIAKVTIILYPIAKLVSYRIDEDICIKNNFDNADIFKDLNKTKEIRTMLMLNIIKVLILISGLSIITAVTLGFSYLGYLIDLKTSLSIYLLMILAIIPGAIVAIVFTVVILIYFEIATLVAASSEEVSVSKAIKESIALYSREKTLSLVKIYAINILIFLGWSLLAVATVFLVLAEFGLIIGYIVALVAVFLLFAALLKAIIAIKVSSLYLFKDILANGHERLYTLNDDLDKEKEEVLISLFESKKSEEL